MKDVDFSKEPVLLRSYVTSVVSSMFPVTPKHELVVPNRPIIGLWDLSNAERLDLFSVVIARARMHFPCNVLINLGEEAGQTVRQPHIHIIPRAAGDSVTLDTGFYAKT